MEGSWMVSKWPNMFLSARSPGSCRHPREQGLHLDGDIYGKMFLCAQLSAPFCHTHRLAVEAIPHLCVSERNRPILVWRRLSLTYVVLSKQIPGGVGQTFLINVWSQELFPCHSMLYLYSANRVKLMPDWAESFSSFSAASTNGCLDLSCRSCPRSGDKSLLCRRCSGS